MDGVSLALGGTLASTKYSFNYGRLRPMLQTSSKTYNMKWTIFFLTTFSFLLFTACQNNKPSGDSGQEAVPLTPEEVTLYTQRGKEIAQGTFAAMSGELLSAMQRGGVAEASRYCNLAAYPLVDSLSKVYEADIRRTSLKIRNPKDQPTAAERAMLLSFQQLHEAGEPMKPVVQPQDANTVAFYAPIQIQPLCLQCHGKLGETLKEADYAVIKELYPADEAIGYSEGDLRGIWSIQFRKKL